MIILRNPVKQISLLYIATIIITICVGVFSTLFFIDGAPHEAMEMWLVTLILTVLMNIAVFFFGYVYKKNRVEFDENSIHIKRAFMPTRLVKWNEIASIKGNMDGFVIYAGNAEQLFTITPSMINYELFYKILREKCGRCFEDYSNSFIKQQRQVLKINRAYLAAAVLGMMLFGLYAFMALQAPEEFIELITDDSVGLFEKFFAPVTALISMIVLFVTLKRKIYYSKYKFVICPLFGEQMEIEWRKLSKVEVMSTQTRSGTIIKKLIFSTTSGKRYKIHTAGFRGTEQYEEFLNLMLEQIKFHKIELIKISK